MSKRGMGRGRARMNVAKGNWESGSRFRLGKGLLWLSLLMGLVLACGLADIGSDSETATPLAVSASPTPVPPTVAGTPQATAERLPTATPGSPGQITRGERIYQETAGGVGCRLCHGPEARGAYGPDVRGVPAELITAQFIINRDMSFIELSEADVVAVAAYLQYLATQP